MRRRLTAGLTILAALLALCASCAAPSEDTGLRLWFPVALSADRPPDRAVAGEAFDTDRPADVDSLMAALLAGPEDSGLTNPFPRDTRLLGSTHLANGVLQLDMSAPYGDLTGIDLTLADYCITLTLCQLEGVEQVYITVNGGEISYRSRQYLSPDDAIFTGAEEEPRQVSAVLYFPRAVGKGLGFEVRELTLTEDDDLYGSVTQALMKGPIDGDLHSLMPEGAELINVRVDDGICYVNFSAAFVEAAPTDVAQQNLLLYSVVDTLGNLDAITAVQILVEDEILRLYGGVSTEQPLEPNFGLVSGEG